MRRRMDDGIRLRPATMQDAERLWRWRNDPETRANSIQTEPVPWPAHVAWLEGVLLRPESRRLFIAELAGEPVGTVREDIADNELSWTVAPEHRGKGIGRAMVALAVRPGHVAKIKRDNAASQKIAETCGFELTEDGELQTWIKRG